VVAEAASQSSLMGLRMTMTILPIIGMFAAVIVFRRKFILNEAKVDEITETLKSREGRA
jgi:melibiose permease